MHRDVNEFQVAKSLDIVPTNSYHGTQDYMDGESRSEVSDHARSLKRANYLVTETNAQTTDWTSAFQFPPYDGQLRLDVYTYLSSGANMVQWAPARSSARGRRLQLSRIFQFRQVYWAEFLMPEHAEAMAYYDHPFFGRWPAITRNTFGAVRVKHGVNGVGKRVHYYLKHSNQSQAFRYPYAPGTELLSGSAATASRQFEIKPWDLVIIEER